MKAKTLEQLAWNVSPQSARQYVLAKGWQRAPDVNGGIALFQRAGSDLDQLVIPLQASGPDFARRIVDVLVTLSEHERRPAEEILNDLLMPDADVIRYRLISPDTAQGTLSLDDGLRVLDGARRSLLAAACSVISPVPYHPRMSRSEATQLLAGCRLLQTERGSYTVAIACPLRATEETTALSDSQGAFARRTTETLLQSAQRLVKAIEADKVPSLYQDDPTSPVISANLCDAILRMQPPDKRSQLHISVSSAATANHRLLAGLPQQAIFHHDYFPVIDDIYNKIYPS